MKTKIIFVLSAIIVLTGLVIACQLEEIEEKVTVTFVSNGSSSVNPVTLDRGGKLGGSYPTPSRDEANFTFSGWYEGFTEYTRETEIYVDITLAAKWTETVEYISVDFDPDEGSLIGSVAVVKGGVLGSSFPAAPRKRGYAFNGWLVDGVELTKDTPIPDNMTATAYWTQLTDTYTVTFDSDGGEGNPEPITVYAGDCVDEWTIQFPLEWAHEDAEMYFFKEWCDEEGVLYTGRTPITRNVTLKATWGIRIPKESIELDLSVFTTTHYNITGAQSAVFDNGALAVTFTAADQMISIENTERLKVLLAIANSVTVEIDADVSHPDRTFRVLVGNPHKLGREWNATNSHDNVPFADLNRVLTISENRAHDSDETVWGDDSNPPNTPDMHRINWLCIQARSTGHSAADPTVVTIRSVKITIE